jgi:hypothetical protein
MFAMSSKSKSKTTGDDANILLRGWCGGAPVFEIMDTPGVDGSEGAGADTRSTKAIVEKLKAHMIRYVLSCSSCSPAVPERCRSGSPAATEPRTQSAGQGTASAAHRPPRGQVGPPEDTCIYPPIQLPWTQGANGER